jgi:xanthine dehydrogenase accessory factor
MNADVLRSALHALETGRSFALVSVLQVDGSSPASPGQKMLVYADGATEGTVGGGGLEQRARAEALAMLARGTGGVLNLALDAAAPGGVDALCGGEAVLAVEIAAAGARVLLCGAGHVARALGRILADLGLAHGVVDARAEQTTRERYPQAAILETTEPPEWIAAGGLAGWAHPVILTHHHALDAATLKAAHRSGFPGYVGMIGSRRKWAETRLRLAADGVPQAWLDQVHCPIGLSIGARSPAEIAVSIAAEIVQTSHDPAHSDTPGSSRPVQEESR